MLIAMPGMHPLTAALAWMGLAHREPEVLAPVSFYPSGCINWSDCIATWRPPGIALIAVSNNSFESTDIFLSLVCY